MTGNWIEAWELIDSLRAEIDRANEVIKVLGAGLLSCQWEFENLGKKHGGLYSENGIELCKQALAKARELQGNGDEHL